MKTPKQKPEIYSERFDFILENETGIISSNELIVYLTSINTMVKSINHTLNETYSIGYDQILVDIEALERGSVKIPVILKKLCANSLFVGISAAIISPIVSNLLSNDKQPITVNNYGGEVTIIESAVIVENKATKKAVSDVAKTVVKSENATQLRIEYIDNVGDKRLKEIDKETLNQLIVADEDDVEKETTILHNANITIVSPVLENSKAMWKVRIGDSRFSAKMVDDNFLSLMDEHKIAFGKGDVIVADLETVVTKRIDNIPVCKYTIKRVHEYPKYLSNKHTELF